LLQQVLDLQVIFEFNQIVITNLRDAYKYSQILSVLRHIASGGRAVLIRHVVAAGQEKWSAI
jgi:hypothetical protein